MTEPTDLTEGLENQPGPENTPRFPPQLMFEGVGYAMKAKFRGVPFVDLTHEELFAVAGNLMHDASVMSAELARREGVPQLILPSDM